MSIALSSASPPPAVEPPPPSSAHQRRRHHPLLPFLERCKGFLHLKEIHARALRTSKQTEAEGGGNLPFFYSRLIHFSAASNLSYASRLLLHPTLPDVSPNSFCFNTLIRAHFRTHLSLRLFRRMLLLPSSSSSSSSSASPDRHTFPFVLKACAFLFALPQGSQIHALILKLAFSSDPYVANSLVHFYSSCGRLPLARRVFDRMPQRTRVSWNVMIDGYATGGEYETALALFRDMQAVFLPDEYTLQSVLRASTGLGALSLGMWAHAFLLKRCKERVANDVLINNSLLDLYSKCGSIAIARQVFSRMPTRDVASWNALILGFAMHGHVKESLDAFSCMSVVDKLKPNPITFVAVLSACSHGGLVEEGQRYFKMMSSEFGIEPELEHYGCMVDLLARKGCIDEAVQLVHDMPCKPDVVIWRSLLDACCRTNAGIEISESVARRVVESEEAATSGVYVLVSRVYASANRWDDVGLVRKIMSEKGIRKEPGCSSIEMDGFVHEFVAGDTSHPQSREIYEKLNEVERDLALVGYEPDSSQAPMVAGKDSVKLDSLRLHSERLAIAFGLLNMKSGMTIRILKNLKVCRDCHTVTKLISQMYHVEIVVRDRTRFHHFKDGSCSCMDYW